MITKAQSWYAEARAYAYDSVRVRELATGEALISGGHVRGGVFIPVRSVIVDQDGVVVREEDVCA